MRVNLPSKLLENFAFTNLDAIGAINFKIYIKFARLGNDFAKIALTQILNFRYTCAKISVAQVNLPVAKKESALPNLASNEFARKLEPQRFFANADLVKLFLPIAIEQFLEYSVGLASSIMAANVGESAVSAVSLVEFVMALFISVFAAIATGGAVIAGQYLGSRQAGNARNAVNQLLWFSVILSLAVVALILAGKNCIFGAVFGDITQEVRRDADAYLTIVAFSLPFLAAYSAGAAIFCTMGNAKLPMYIMLAMNVLNVALTAVAIYTFKMGITGIAVPTLAARVLAAAIVVYLLLDVKLKLHIRKTLKYDFDLAMIKRILSIGVPYGFENGMFFLGRIVVLSLVTMFGTAAIAANAVGGTIAMFQVLPEMAIGMGLTVVISHCVGAGDFEQAKFYAKKVMITVYVAQLVSTAFVLLLLEPILRLYSLSPEAAAMTAQIVWWHGVMMVLIWPLAYTLPVVFRAAADAKYPMWVSIACMFVCRVALAYFFSLTLGLGMLGTWYAMFVDWVVKAVLFTRRYFNGKWTKFKAI